MTENVAGFHDRLTKIVEEFVSNARAELSQRWAAWSVDITTPALHEVLGGLLARQVTLATQLARAPQTWNGHVAPLSLRAMTDGYITLAWILECPATRCDQYVKFGLGQKKLFLEHWKVHLTETGERNVENHPVIKAMEQWLNAERFHFLTEVSVGSWSETDTRSMAEEAGCLDLYRFGYAPLSAAVHNMWHHVIDYNLKTCQNPLHGSHRVPVDPDLAIDPDYLYRAAKYLDKSFRLFDRKTGVSVEVTRSIDALIDALNDALNTLNDSLPDPDMRGAPADNPAARAPE